MAEIKPPAPVVGKQWGTTALPEGEKKRGGFPRIDAGKTTAQIERVGVRWVWSRAAFCPCTPVNTQTDQPDPTCSKCLGRGFFYFGPNNYAPGEEVGKLTPLQESLLGDDGGAVIRGLFTRSTQDQNPYDLIGNWVRGSMFVTVRPENRVGHFDRLINLDSTMVYYEVVEMPATGLVLGLRYRALCVATIQTTTDRYEQDIDFVVNDSGQIVWHSASAPVAGTRLAVHYEMHPTWLVVEHPHVIRESPGRKGTCSPEARKDYPRGRPQALPIQVMVQLEFLAGTRTDAATGST